MEQITTKQTTVVSPYEMYMESQLWKNIDEAITDFVDNNDIVEKTRRDYIVGYICKKLEKRGNTTGLMQKLKEKG
jgi:hypothetical protein